MAESSGFNKRSVDKQQDDIAELIKMENDPERRALLIVLQAINNSLIANTSTVNAIDAQLTLHLIEYRQQTAANEAAKHHANGRNAWTKWAMPTIQAACVAGLGYISSELASLHVMDAKHDAKIVRLETFHVVEHGK